jgi:hypothetical protein
LVQDLQKTEGLTRIFKDDTDQEQATARTTAEAKCGRSFDFAQDRLLHYAADDEPVRCFGRDDELGCEGYLALGCEAAP